MFKKLHLKLTFFNTIILVIFLAIFSIIIYQFMSTRVDKSVESLLNFSAKQVDDINKIPHFKKPLNDGNKLFDRNRFKLFNYKDAKPNYILWNEGFNITETSDDIDEISELKKQAIKVMEENDLIVIKTEINDEKVMLLSKPFNKNNVNGVIQVYKSIELESNLLNNLTTTFLFGGLISTIILGLISYIIAGKSLVPIKKSWNQQKEFVADASHELRTPLTVIQTNLDVALSDEDGTIKGNYEWINNAYTECDKMSKLINDLLLLAKIDSKQISLNVKNFSISNLANEVLNIMKPLINNKNLMLENEIAENININCDEDRIRQLMIILLDNAIKYTPEKGKIEIDIYESKNELNIVVKDTGIGLSENDIDNIFNRFYRADKARSRDEDGTGLGLSIAKWIVDVHGGSIKLQSELNLGSTFIVKIPIYD